jgi:micrococcal nuclease
MSGGSFTDSPARTNLLSWFALGLTLIFLVAACGTTGLDEQATNFPTTTQATPEEPSTGPATSTTIKVLGPEVATVASITDGDTIRVILADGSNVPVRLIGIDAPETNDALTAESKEFLASLLEDQEVYLVPDVSNRDMFDRLLRYVYVGENFINEEMVENGFAVAKEYPPDTAHADELAQAQERAETQSYGLWSTTITAVPTTTTTVAPTTTTTIAPTTTTAAPTTTAPPASNCHPAYSSPCVPTGVSDVDCAGGSGNGPYYVSGPVYLSGTADPYGLDGNDNDGIGCES